MLMSVNFLFLMGLVRLILWIAALFLYLFFYTSFSIPLYLFFHTVISFRWLGISVCNSLSSFRFQTIRDIKNKLKLGYSKIVGNRGHFRRQALTKLYSSFCDHSVLFCSGVYMLLNKGDVKRAKTDYYRYCKFLLYLPRSFRNRRLMSQYQATDIVLSVEKLSSKLIDDAPIRLGPNHRLIRLFS